MDVHEFLQVYDDLVSTVVGSSMDKATADRAQTRIEDLETRNKELEEKLEYVESAEQRQEEAHARNTEALIYASLSEEEQRHHDMSHEPTEPTEEEIEQMHREEGEELERKHNMDDE